VNFKTEAAGFMKRVGWVQLRAGGTPGFRLDGVVRRWNPASSDSHLLGACHAGAGATFGVIVGRTCLARRCSHRRSDRRWASNVPRTVQRFVARTQAHRSSLVWSNQSEKRLTLSAGVCTVEKPTNA